MQDPAFFLTKLCHAASRKFLSEGNAAEALSLQNESIRIIQRRLECSDLGDFTVCAVTGMLCNEVQSWTLLQRAHGVLRSSR